MTFAPPTPAVTAYVALGSNLDDPVRQVQSALQAMADSADIALVKVSAFYQTAPVGIVDQPPFVNAVAEISTRLSPNALLAALHAIEATHGRLRHPDLPQNGPRTLDLDILLFDNQCIDDSQLTLPHPRMHQRAFVMVPLAEIAPAAVIPGQGIAKAVLATLDCAGVHRLSARELSREQPCASPYQKS